MHNALSFSPPPLSLSLSLFMRTHTSTLCIYHCHDHLIPDAMFAHLSHERLKSQVYILEDGLQLIALIRVRVEAIHLHVENVALGAERRLRVDDLGHLHQLPA